MTTGPGEIDLPRVTRDIRTGRPRPDRTAGPTSHLMGGILRPFTGVLGHEPWRADWPRPALSFLRLAPRFVPTVQNAGTDRQAAAEDNAEADDRGGKPHDDDRRVRDVLAAKQGAADEGHTEDSPVTAVERIATADRLEIGPDRSVRSPHHTGDTGVPTAPQLQPDRGSRSAPAEPRGSSGASPRDAGDDSAPHPVDGPRLEGQAGSDAAHRFVAPRDVSSGGPLPAEQDPSSDERDGEPATRDRATVGMPEGSATSVVVREGVSGSSGPMHAAPPGPDTAPNARGTDRPSMEPLRAAIAPPIRWSPSGDGQAHERDVRSTVDSRRSDLHANADAGRRENGTNGESNHRDTPADRPRQPHVAANDQRRLDDIVDVDRLADRLARVFERKSRIERERHGR